MGMKQDALGRLAKAAATPVHEHKGLRLVRWTDARSVVDAAERLGVLILGLDVVHVTEDRTQATDQVADFSSLTAASLEEACAQAASSARRFLDEVGAAGAWVEFTLSEPGGEPLQT